MAACPRCGQQNPEQARFCNSCGGPLEVPRPAREVRKTVTAVFTDVTGSTSLGERLDPESLRRVMSRYFDEMRAVLERHGGTVEKFIGDAVVAVFGIPVLHEDDALRAVRAADEMRQALARLNDELEATWGVRIEVRTGVNTGEVVAGDPSTGQSFVVGDAVNVAARLEQAAAPGEILIGETTLGLVRDAVETESVAAMELRGKSEAVGAHRLQRVVEGAPGVQRRLDSPIVGRAHERALLAQAFDRVEGERGCHMFTVLGAAGVGKTRLVSEFLGSVRSRATVATGRCLPYGEGITYWPVVELVRSLAGLAGDEQPDQALARIRALAGGEEAITHQVGIVMGLVEDTASPEEGFRAVRRLLEGVAADGSLVVVFDDIHWAEPTFLDLIEHIADWSRDAPILLLCMARPDLLDARPGWGGGKLNATSILLESLTDADCGALMENLLGQASLAPAVRERITDAAEGNPLFVEEMLSMMIDADLLYRDDGHWAPSRDLSDVAIPPTIHALLAARLDQLASEERAVVERASIEGKVFHRGAVAALSSNGGALDSSLMTLVRKELIRPTSPEFTGEEAFRFRHQLIRDAAYDAMPKEARAELHERFAGWLERAAADRVVEHEEILGYHLEQAYRYREQLGPVDERGRALAARAGERLASAGRRAHARSDVAATSKLLGRAVGLLGEDHPERGTLLLQLGTSLIQGGRFDDATGVMEEASARSRGDEVMRARTQLHLREIKMMQGQASLGETLREIEEPLADLERAGDDEGLAEAWRLRGALLFWTGNAGRSVGAMERSLEHARRTGDPRALSGSIEAFVGPLVWGPIPVDDGLRRIQRLNELGGGQGGWRLQSTEGCLLAMIGRLDEARILCARADETTLDLGLRLGYATSHGIGQTLLIADDPLAVIERFEPAVGILQEMGEVGFLATTAYLVAEASYRLGRDEDAWRYIEITRAGSDDDDLAVEVQWRSVMAKLMARRGDAEEAARLASEGVEIASRSDHLIIHAPACDDLGEVSRLTGKRDDALRSYGEAVQLYERKGATFLAERTRRAMAALSAGGA